MERVWLSTTYYLDPSVISLSADAERMFTRGLAYCGAAETRGFIPDSALTQIGNKRGSKPVRELTDAELWTKVDGGYRVRSWSHWQKNGDDLLRRRASDRKRKQRERENVRGQSRDTSRDVTGGEESREEKENSKEFSNPPQVSDAGEAEEMPRGPAVPGDGWSIVRRVIPSEHSQATKTALSIEVAALLKQGTAESDVVAALQIWLGKSGLGPRVLPHLLSDVIRGRAAPPGLTQTAMSTADQRVAQAQALKSENYSFPAQLEIQ